MVYLIDPQWVRKLRCNPVCAILKDPCPLKDAAPLYGIPPYSM